MISDTIHDCSSCIHYIEKEYFNSEFQMWIQYFGKCELNGLSEFRYNCGNYTKGIRKKLYLNDKVRFILRKRKNDTDRESSM